jgi:hypothetical protein
MFRHCTSLVSAPNSDVYTTKTPTQSDMFTNCTALMTPLPYCVIPTSWGGGGNNCAFVQFTNATSITPKFTVSGTSFEYSLNGGAWTSVSSGTAISTSGNPIRFRGLGRTALFTTDSGNNTWSISGTGVIISGNMNALLNYSSPPSTLPNYAFSSMFRSNSSIKTVVATFPATNIGYGCYNALFYDCANLTTAPVSIAATTLGNVCYNNMFGRCTSLVTAPELPATTVPGNCYQNMFNGCTKLTTAPGCDRYTGYAFGHDNMFTNCTALTTPLYYCEIPTYFGGGGNCQYIRFSGATSVTPVWATPGSAIEYSINNGNWVNATNGTAISTSGNSIRFRGSGRTTLFQIPVSNNAWTLVGSNITISGNMNALLDYNNPPTSIGSCAFCIMFYNQTSIKTFNASLPSTTLANYCYSGMFMNCTSLVNAPFLPATTLADRCYYTMFSGCTSLVNAPGCDTYTQKSPPQAEMFKSCNALTSPMTYANIPSGWK